MSLTDAVVAQRIVYRDARALDHRLECSHQRHHQPDDQFDGQHLRRQAEGREGHVEKAGQQACRLRGGKGSQGHGDEQRQHAKDGDQRQVHGDDLAVARADGLHDADLAHLLAHQRVDGIDHQEATQQQRHGPKREHQADDGLQDGVARRLARLSHHFGVDLAAAALDLVLNLGGDGEDGIGVGCTRLR